MNNEILEQLSFSLDLMNLSRKLADAGSSVEDESRISVYLVEKTLRAKGVRPSLPKNEQ